jgi:hypothetical protein
MVSDYPIDILKPVLHASGLVSISTQSCRSYTLCKDRQLLVEIGLSRLSHELVTTRSDTGSGNRLHRIQEELEDTKLKG